MENLGSGRSISGVIGFIVGCLLFLPVAASAETVASASGALGGSFTGTVQLPDNTTSEIVGNVSGSWDASMDDAGNIAASASGMFGADGMGASFQVSYDSARQQFRGYWGGASVEIMSDPIIFISRTNGDTVNFVAPITGRIPTEDGGLPFEGEVELEFLPPPEASAQGLVTGTFTADISYEVSGSMVVPVVGSYPVNVSGTSPSQGQVTGQWDATYAGGVVTGGASGVFSGTVPVSVSTPVGPYNINVPYSGNWQGTLGLSGQTILFEGSWEEPHLEVTGTASSSFGGPFSVILDTATESWPLPITFSCPDSGGSFVDPDTGLHVNWSMRNFQGTGELSMQ